jgi:hypothetical protein
MAQPPAIRASDAERERVVTRLREAAGDGRLDPDEFDERLGAAFQARTRDPLIVGDSDFFWPIVPIVAWGAAIVLKRRPRRPRLTA